MPKGIKISKITDSAFVEAIFSLRFDSLVKEMGLECSGAARSLGKLADEADATGHQFAAVATDGTVVGAARVNLMREAVPEPFASLLRILGDEAPDLDSLSVTSRWVVSSGQRRSGLAARLALAVYEFGLENGILTDVIFAHPRHVEMFIRMGYRRSSTALVAHPQGSVVPLILKLRDRDHLLRIKSIFRRDSRFGAAAP